jgi:hypothetical protein
MGKTNEKTAAPRSTHQAAIITLGLLSLISLMAVILLWQRTVFMQNQVTQNQQALQQTLKATSQNWQKKWQTQDQTNTMLFNQFSAQTYQPQIIQQKIEQNLSMAIWQLAFFKNSKKSIHWLKETEQLMQETGPWQKTQLQENLIKVKQQLSLEKNLSLEETLASIERIRTMLDDMQIDKTLFTVSTNKTQTLTWDKTKPFWQQGLAMARQWINKAFFIQKLEAKNQPSSLSQTAQNQLKLNALITLNTMQWAAMQSKDKAFHAYRLQLKDLMQSSMQKMPASRQAIFKEIALLKEVKTSDVLPKLQAIIQQIRLMHHASNEAYLSEKTTSNPLS